MLIPILHPKCLYFLSAITLLLFSNCKSSISSTEPAPIDLEKIPSSLEIFGEGILSTDLYERDIAIAPDGRSIIFTVGNYTQTVRALAILQKHDKQWSDPEILPFSGTYQDIEPFFSTSGDTLYFASTRPLDGDSARSDYNIWRVTRKPDGWEDPKPLPVIINTPGNEFYPSLSANGNLYFTAAYENAKGLEDIYYSRIVDGRYMKPEPLDSNINSPSYEFNAFVSPKEDLLIFTSYGRADGLGGGDLYFSRKDALGQWQKATHAGKEVNSEALDFCPFVDYKRGNFYFTSSRGKPFTGTLSSYNNLLLEARKTENGMGNIYRIGLEEVIGGNDK